jgi:hypothetical protein
LNLRDHKLWVGKTGEEIWEIYKADQHRRVSDLFAADRSRAVVKVKEAPQTGVKHCLT